FGGHRVEPRRPDVRTAERSEIAVPEIVGEDDHDVRRRLRLRSDRDSHDSGEEEEEHRLHRVSSSSTMIVSTGSTASVGSFTMRPTSCSVNSALRPPLMNRALWIFAPSGGSSTARSGASRTCTYTRFPFRVVTPQG